MTSVSKALAICVMLSAVACGGGDNGSPPPTSLPDTQDGNGPSLDDASGEVVEWSFNEDVPGEGNVGEAVLRQIDQRTLGVGWWAGLCDDDPRLTIREDMSMFLDIDTDLSDRLAECPMIGIYREYVITFSVDVDVESVNVELSELPMPDESGS